MPIVRVLEVIPGLGGQIPEEASRKLPTFLWPAPNGAAAGDRFYIAQDSELVVASGTICRFERAGYELDLEEGRPTIELGAVPLADVRDLLVKGPATLLDAREAMSLRKAWR